MEPRSHRVTPAAPRALLSLLATVGLAACGAAESGAASRDAAAGDVAADVVAPDVAVPDVVAPDVIAPDVAPADAPVDVVSPDVQRTLAWRAVPAATTADLRSVWGSASGDVWAVGESTGRAGGIGTMVHWDSRDWQAITLPDEASCQTNRCGLASVWGRGARDVWVVGWGPSFASTDRTMVLHFDGSGWAFQGAPHATYDVWRTGAFGPDGDVWIAGAYGDVARWSGRGWTATNVVIPGGDGGVAQPSPYFRGMISGLWPTARDGVWAVGGSEGGGRAFITRWDGRAWHLDDTGRAPTLEAIWGVGASVLWSVGQQGTILHGDGRAWTAMDSGTTQPLHGVWGTSATDVWAVGDGGTIVHWNGRAWTAATSGTTRSLHGVWGTSATDVWAVGDGGTVLHYALDV